MKLDEWRRKENLSYENLGRLLGMTTSKTFRIINRDPCIKLRDANIIVQVTKGKVGFEDLLTQGDC